MKFANRNMMRIRWTPILLSLPILSPLIGWFQSPTASNGNQPCISSRRHVLEGFLSSSSITAAILVVTTANAVSDDPESVASSRSLVGRDIHANQAPDMLAVDLLKNINNAISIIVTSYNTVRPPAHVNYGEYSILFYYYGGS
jgi:di/tricarboxylate transporter